MEVLKPYRKRIDDLDDQIVDLLAAREAIIHEVAALKLKEGLPAVLQDRVDEVRERCKARAGEKGANAEFIAKLYADIIKFSCDLEETYLQQKDKSA